MLVYFAFVGSVLGGVFEFFGGIGDAIGGFFGGIADTIGGIGEAIFGFFAMIVDFIGTIIDLFVMLVNAIVQLFMIIPQAVGYLAGTVNMVPDVVKPFILITITGSIVFLILNRSSGKEN
jgi:hypothetical protein